MLNIKAKHVINKIVWDEKAASGELHKEENEDVTIVQFFTDADGNPNFLYLAKDKHFYVDNIKYFHYEGASKRRKTAEEK